MGKGCVMMGARRLSTWAMLAMPVVASCEHGAVPSAPRAALDSYSAKPSGATAIAPSAPLKSHAFAKGLYFGTMAYSVSLRTSQELRDAVINEAAIVTPPLEMKWESLEPVPGGHDFRGADEFMEFARKSRLGVRGHTLMWFRSHPSWLPAHLNPANADSILQRHIAITVGRYRGRIQSWDVLNEAVEPLHGRVDGLRKDIWLAVLGPDYIARAFRYARAADPEAQLVYNEYGLESDTPAAALKRTAVLTLIRKLLSEDVPIDALGLQVHIEPSAPFDANKLHQFLDEVSALGLSIILTEVDVDERDMPGNFGWRDALVAAALARYLPPFFAHPAVEGVITWGISDRFHDNFPRPDKLPARGMLLDADLQRKPAWTAVMNAIRNSPRECVQRNSLLSGDRTDGLRRGAFECRRASAP
jgi:endo-1,4-beta-xylanase